MSDVAEEGHADDGVDEGDEGEQGANVEQRGQRHDQREQQLPNAFRRLKRRIHFVILTLRQFCLLISRTKLEFKVYLESLGHNKFSFETKIILNYSYKVKISFILSSVH